MEHNLFSTGGAGKQGNFMMDDSSLSEMESDGFEIEGAKNMQPIFNKGGSQQ